MPEDIWKVSQEWRTKLDEYSRLSPSVRGKALETLVADIFRTFHFTVILDAGVARPRQTDVLAVRTSDRYLIECKWTSDSPNIDDIDSLRSRLSRTSGDIVGLLISVNGFSDRAKAHVEQDRQRPILLLSGNELRRVIGVDGPSLLDLLWRKQEALLRDGQALVDEDDQPTPRRRRLLYPEPESRFTTGASDQAFMIDFNGRFGQFVFADEIPDIDWYAVGGHGVVLDIAPRVANENRLLDAMDILADHGWTTAHARWKVGQAERSWFGLGLGTFRDEIPKWRDRSGTPGAHHSEEFMYVDRCDGGFYTITGALDSQKNRTARYVNVSFQLSGVPVDPMPMLHLCRSLGVHEGLHYRPREAPSLGRVRGLQVPITGAPSNWVTYDDAFDPTTGPWASGIVVPNPYHQEGELAAQLPDPLTALANNEMLVCSLSDHHLADRHPTQYWLTGFDYARSSDGLICRPIANW